VKNPSLLGQLLSQGVKGDGDFYQMVFQYEKPQEAVLSAAMTKLSNQNGELQLRPVR
jgi:hypothetical protein